MMSLLYSSTCLEHNCAHQNDVTILLQNIWCHHTFQVAFWCTILSQLLLVNRVNCCSCLECIVEVVLCVLLQLPCVFLQLFFVYYCSCFVCIVVVVLCVLLQLSCVYFCSCLVCIVVTLCLFIAIYLYGCFYFRCHTAGQKLVFGRSCDRPSRHLFFLHSLCL